MIFKFESLSLFISLKIYLFYYLHKHDLHICMTKCRAGFATACIIECKLNVPVFTSTFLYSYSLQTPKTKGEFLYVIRVLLKLKSFYFITTLY